MKCILKVEVFSWKTTSPKIKAHRVEKQTSKWPLQDLLVFHGNSSTLIVNFRNVGVPDYDILVDQIIQTNADGFNGDTLDGVNQTFWEAGLNNGHPIVIEPEVNNMSTET